MLLFSLSPGCQQGLVGSFSFDLLLQVTNLREQRGHTSW